MSGLLLILLLASPSKYPLASTFVRDSGIVLVELGKNELSIPTPGLLVESAALSADKSQIAFTANTDGTTPTALYLMSVSSLKVERLDTGLRGPHQSPSFTADGRHVVFAAAAEPNANSENPTRTRRWNIARRRLDTEKSASTHTCQFHPAPIGNQDAHLSTNCFGTFALSVPSPDGGTQMTRLPSPDIETAASFDGTRIVYTSRSQSGLTLFLQIDGKPAQRVLTLPSRTSRIQPRFICPRDVMFTKENSFWRVNTDSLEVSRIDVNGDGGVK